MTETFKPPIPVSRLHDPDMQAAPAALVRAAIRARELALQTNTPLVVMEDGKLVEKWLRPEDLAGLV